MKEINKFNKLMAFLALIGFMAITSCDEQEEINPSSTIENAGLDVEGNGTPPGPANCQGNNNVTLNGTSIPAGPLLGQYCSFGEILYTLCSAGPAGPELAFEGQFNSFIRPLTSGWSIGIIPLNQYNSAWSTILPTIQAEASNPGQFPNEQCSGFFASPEDVVGLNGSFTPPAPGAPAQNFGLGYYNYDLGPNQPNITDAIVVWKGGTSSNPQTASEAFVIRVDALNSIPGPDTNGDMRPDSFSSQVIFDYRKAL